MPVQVSAQISARWTPILMEHSGFTPVPNFFLHHYHSLNPKISHAEAIFVIHLISFKWKKEAPFPSLAKIAEHMGITPQATRAYVRSLEKKGYVQREQRTGLSNRFHLEKLFSALESLCTQFPSQERASATPAIDEEW